MSLPQIVNASNWSCEMIVGKCCYSPNPEVLLKYRESTTEKFWLSTYIEFAAIIVDPDNHLITLVRDHFGVEPLFYYFDEQQLIFGSSPSDIIGQLGFTPLPNDSVIQGFILNLYFNSATYTDETIHQEIYRLEPGCLLEIRDGQPKKSRYWSLAEDSTPIFYPKEQDYYDRFDELLQEAIKEQAAGYTDIAAEFSGGLDSSTVVTGLLQSGITPELYMHIAPHGSTEVDDSVYAQEVIHRFSLEGQVNLIAADSFELEAVIHQIAQWFTGTPAYLFPFCANNIHVAVREARHPLLLSGFGGDECISGHAPLFIYLREQCLAGNFVAAKQELALTTLHAGGSSSSFRQWLQIKRATYSWLNSGLYWLREMQSRISSSSQYTNPLGYYNPQSIREHEYNFLQGAYSHHVRLRVEESAIVARQMGFKYRYPLLYPKLVEFCYQLPLEFKRANAENRIMVRKYLSKFLPETVYGKHQKVGGIMPATVSKVKQEYFAGRYKELFAELPYSDLINKFMRQFPEQDHQHLINQILMATMKAAQK